MKTTTPLYVVGNELADAKYGPYLTTTQALNLLPIGDRKIGQTVGVYDGTGIVEYWFKDGIQDIDLIAKSSGGSGDMLKATYDIDDDGVVDSAETVKIIVRNSTGSTLTKGQIVYLSGATGNRPNAVLADATDEATSSKTIGMVAANIANNADGYVAVSGTLHDLDTTSFTAGDSLWLSETSGAMQANTPPAEPAHAVFIGYVARSHPTQGRIVLAIQNGYELTELHGVTITSPATNDFLYYASDGIWKNKQLSASDMPTGIDATKINSGAVSNTEFNYLDGVTSSIQTQINSKEPTITAGTSSQYYRGDKTFQTLDKTAVGLGNVDNTADASKTFAASQITSGTFDNARIPQVSRPNIRITTAVSSGNSTSEQNITSITIPANSLAVGDIIRLGAMFSFASNTSTKTPRIRFGLNTTTGTILYGPATLAASTTINSVELIGIVTSTTNLRLGPVSTVSGLGTGTGATINHTIDITTSTSFSFNVQKNAGTDTAILEFSWVEILTS